MKKALLLIDLQNDYFSDGAFPLWNTEAVLSTCETAVHQAQRQDIPVILIQHVANPQRGRAPFFNAETTGVQLHPRIVAAAPAATRIVKAFADSFHQTALDQTLQELHITDLLIGGLMTQNCVTHTALSKAAEKYAVTILPDCCTTVSEILHKIALNALSTRIPLVASTEALR